MIGTIFSNLENTYNVACYVYKNGSRKWEMWEVNPRSYFIASKVIASTTSWDVVKDWQRQWEGGYYQLDAHLVGVTEGQNCTITVLRWDAVEAPEWED